MATPILALRDVTLADGRRTLFDHVDLALEPGSRGCLVGRNGLGKSTLLRLLAGTLEADSGQRMVKAGARIALVGQEPIVEGETFTDFATGSGAADHDAQEALEWFGLDPLAPARDLSGGEARRAALAAAFALEPDVLLLDEPTNHLDVLAIEKLEKRIASARAAVLIVSHDRTFLEGATTKCFWLEHGRVRRLDAGFSGFDAWAQRIEEEQRQTERRLDVALSSDERWLARGVTARRARNEGRLRRLHELRAQKAEHLRRARAGLRVDLAQGPLSGRLVIEADGVSKGFGARRLLSDFSARILRGDRLAIIGANGAGKSTLIKLLLGEAEPDEGSIRRGANLHIAYIDQKRAPLKPGMTLIDFLVPSGGDQVMVNGAPRHVAAYAKDFLFRQEQLRQPVESLSGGERNRLLLAGVLAQPSNLLVLDEPTNDLDLETLEILEELLAAYEGTVMLVSHDRDFIDRLATSTIALDGEGRWVETPGGWSDFIGQNPDFLLHGEPTARAKPPAKPKKAATPSVKLSYGEARRLVELEAAISQLPKVIAAAERLLADPDLYLRDPVAFETNSRRLSESISALAAAEDEWLALDDRRERLAATAANATD